LLQAAFREIHRSGFQSASIDTILAATNVTKGALYYHFESKEALGYAVVEEVLTEITRQKWLTPLHGVADPLAALANIFTSTSLRPEHVTGGCPLNNLAQEMSPLDEGFRKRLASVFAMGHGAIAGAARRAQGRPRPTCRGYWARQVGLVVPICRDRSRGMSSRRSCVWAGCTPSVRTASGVASGARTLVAHLPWFPRTSHHAREPREVRGNHARCARTTRGAHPHVGRELAPPTCRG